MILLLVRHAVTDVTGKKLTGWLPGIPLSEEGRREADEAGKRLAGAPLKAIYSSPLERCTQTAEAIASHHPLEVRTLEDLGEVHYGDWQGKSMKMLYKSKGWKELRARPADFRFPGGGETVREAQTRAIGAIEGLLPKHKGQAVVVCSHADVIRLLVAGYLGLPIDLYSRISIAPASLTAIILEDATPRLVKLGDTASLDGFWQLPQKQKARGPRKRAPRAAVPAGAGTVPLEGPDPDA